MTTRPARDAGARAMEPHRLAVLVLAACACALPFFLWGFRTYQLAFAAVNAIAILGLNLIAGQAGLISLGHGAFYGLGAYTLAVLMRHWGVSAYAGITAAALVGLVTGYLFGRVVTRLAGFYLALTTFALALALPQTLKSSYVSPWTGGAQGLYLDRPGAPLGLPVTPDQWWYYCLDHGQHISFYTLNSLQVLADRYSLNLYSDKRGFHLMTNRKISTRLFRLLCRDGVVGLLNGHFTRKSLLDEDYKRITGIEIN